MFPDRIFCLHKRALLVVLVILLPRVGWLMSCVFELDVKSTLLFGVCILTAVKFLESQIVVEQLDTLCIRNLCTKGDGVDLMRAFALCSAILNCS